MSLVAQTIPALFNGISQQPATLRLPSQGSEQVNAYSTVVDGLSKRPPLEHVTKLTSDSLATSGHIHTINRDSNERYIVVVTDGALKVYDINGDEKVVNAPEGLSYLSLNGNSANDSFSLVTIADYSFVINKSVVVETKIPDVTEPEQFVNEHWFNPQYGTFIQDVVREDYYQRNVGALERGTVQTFNDLPKPEDDIPPANGWRYKVAGYDEDSFGAYYVIRRGGVWEETLQEGAEEGLNELTMPHALVRESDGTFSFKPFTWKIRQFGDAESNPSPSFVGKTLRDVFYYKNRLGLLAGENIIFSGAGVYDNFYRSTVTALLDSDLVDVAVSSAKVSQLEYAVPFQNNLMLFSDQTQFILNVDELLTPTSVSIDTATEYDVAPGVRPVGIGSDVYFLTESGNHSRVREYFVRNDSTNGSAATDVTAHVPRYLPRGIKNLAGNSNEDLLCVISDEEGHTNRVYIYKFFWTEDGKVQSSWSHWEVNAADDAKLIAVATLENHIYVLIERTDGVYLERADVQSGYVTGDLDYAVLLDRLTGLSGTYLSGSDETQFTLPYPVTDTANYQLVRGSSFSGEVLTLIDPSTYIWTDSTTILVPGNQTAGTVYGGVPYEMKYTFSEQFVKNSGGDAVTTGRFMLRTFILYYTRTAFFSTSVAPYGISPDVDDIVPGQLADFTGKTVGQASLIVGEPSFGTGSYAFQIYGNSREAKVSLINNTHVQSSFQSVEIEGFYTNRAKLI